MFKPRKRVARSKLVERRRQVTLRYVLLILILFVSISAASSYILHRDSILITHVFIEGNEVVTDNDIQTLVQNELQGKYMFLFPKASIFIYPKKHLEASVLSVFERVQTASVSFVDFQSITVEIKERSPYALWCRKSVVDLTEKAESDNNDECFFLDEKGFIYATAPHFSGNTFFRYYGTSGLEDVIGERFLRADSFREIVFFVNTLRTISLNPVALFITSETNMEIVLADGSRMLLRRDKNLRETLENIQSFFESDEYVERGDNDLDYVDFRFGNKVYYTF